MTNSWEPQYPRRVPERRRRGHQPRAPRWTLKFEQPESLLTCDYLAIQVPVGDNFEDFLNLAHSSHGEVGDSTPDAWEFLVRASDTRGFVDLVHVGYWKDATQHERWLLSAPLAVWFKKLDPQTISFGAWHEVIQSPMDRFETIYSDPRKDFGIAAVPGAAITEMTTNGYFGAARDRLPVSAIDTLEAPEPFEQRIVDSSGRRLRVESGHNMAVIRSGQYWEPAEGEQLEDYEKELQPKLQRGMDYLDQNQMDTGTLSLRNFISLDKNTYEPLRETSTLAYFHSLGDLEKWAAGHTTHHAIYHHAIEKNREYGPERTVVTWHEIFVLPRSSRFEYVNCHPDTGLLGSGRAIFSVQV